MSKLKNKKICNKFLTYEPRFNAIQTHYPKNSLIIEGHFHQGLVHQNYISLPSLACQGKVAICKNTKIVFTNFNLLRD